MHPKRLIPAVLALTILLPAAALGGAVSEWTSQIADVDTTLRQGKWKAGRRQAAKLTEQVLSKSWYGAGLRESLTDLALFRAVAEANLGNREVALWYWYIAQNLDRRVKNRDLSPYGDAAKLLLEFPLRRRGEVPPGFEIREETLYSKVDLPRPGMAPRKDILNNTAAVREKPGDCLVELVIDEKGGIHHPVLVSDYLHPIILYAVLDWLREAPPFHPARIDGEAVDFITVLTVNFDFSRW